MRRERRKRGRRGGRIGRAGLSNACKASPSLDKTIGPEHSRDIDVRGDTAADNGGGTGGGVGEWQGRGTPGLMRRSKAAPGEHVKGTRLTYV
ncbi:hypothetical protein E2C01_060233 [Portunus trituberculatus]|uniref:Uncharacterized protein n=1 Tax=Portunus trituberculatus TaxID=210409 RepID=A0A5B7H1Q0_PORTR|nr:hypothetical protein [Portunus trituberculatus]